MIIIEARGDVVALDGTLDRDLWPTIQAAANLLLRQHPQGIIVDGAALVGCTPEGAKTFREAMNYIERYKARIVVSCLSEPVMDVLRSVPDVRSRLPVSDTIDDARASLKLSRAEGAQARGRGRPTQDIVVPLLRADTPEAAVMLACRLAKAEEQKSRIHLAYILEVSRQLPLTAPLPAEEADAARTLDAAASWVKREGLDAVPHVLRTRDAGEEIVQQAALWHAGFVVLTRPCSGDDGEDALRRIIQTVLERAPCEVILNKLPPGA